MEKRKRAENHTERTQLKRNMKRNVFYDAVFARRRCAMFFRRYDTELHDDAVAVRSPRVLKPDPAPRHVTPHVIPRAP